MSLVARSFRYVFNRKENQRGCISIRDDFPTIEKHPSRADARKAMLDLKILKYGVRRKDIAKELAKVRDITFAVTDPVKIALFGFSFCSEKGPVKGAVRRNDPQVGALLLLPRTACRLAL